MKKTNALWIILDLIFLIIFNAVFFIAGGVEHPASVWISYAFIHFSYLMLVITPFLVRKGSSAAIFGFSLYSISSVYFFVELVTGVIFILISSESYKAALLVQLVIAGLYTVCLISNMIANEHTADSQEKRQHQIDYIKQASSEMSALLNTVNERTMKKRLEKVYDALSTSPVKTHPNVMQLESQILSGIRDLCMSCQSNEGEIALSQVDALLKLIEERNRQLKILN